MGRHQRRRRKPLRIRLATELLDANPSPRPDRNNIADSLREFPCQAAARLEGEQHTAFGKPADQSVSRSRTQQELAANDYERVLSSAVGAVLDRAGDSPFLR